MPHLITREKLRLEGACYSDERLAEVIPPEGLTPRQVAVLDIPPDYRMWMLVHASGAQKNTLVSLAIFAGRQSIACAQSPNPHCVLALNIAELYARGGCSHQDVIAVSNTVRGVVVEEQSGAEQTSGPEEGVIAYFAETTERIMRSSVAARIALSVAHTLSVLIYTDPTNALTATEMAHFSGVSWDTLLNHAVELLEADE